IEQIEQMSVEAEPAVEVYPLVHVDCLPLATLLSELYEEVYSARQGSVSITALVKPNSLLLIGREESVKTVVDLIRRLDHPVPPSTQFEAFRLKNTPAETAMETIEEFFTDRYEDEEGGLGARIRLADDFRTNSLFVWASPRDLAEVAAIIARLDGEQSDSFNQVQIFRLKNSLAADLAPVLQDAITGQMYGQRTGQRAVFQRAGTGEQFERKSIRLQFVTGNDQDGRLLDSGILTDAQVTADERANALIVTASAESMPLIAALIKELDSLPTAEAMVKVFTVFHSDASNLMDMLEDLFGSQTQSADLAVRTGAGAEDSSLVSLRFAVDVRTNSVIATGSAGDLEVVEGILARLDESDLRERQTVVINLKNASAENVSTAVNDFLATELEAQQPVDGLLSSIEQIDREVVIVPEIITNSLILSATDQYFSRIVDLIEKLDARPPMVLIQVLIAAVRLDETDEFGVELGLQDSILFDRSLAGIPGFLFNSTGPLGNNTSVDNTHSAAGQGISNFSLGRSNSELGYGGLVLSASSESVSVLIRALQEEQRIEVLGRPQIMTTDMVEARILVGERVRIPTTTSTTDSGQVNLGTEQQEVGLSLNVLPRITPDGQVIMEVLTSRSQLGDEEDGTVIAISDDGTAFRSPRIEIAETETTVSAMDGQTVILSGLITKDTSELHRQVPYLGDIPVLGHLFRFDSVEEIKTELLIILTPHIIQSIEDLEVAKQIEAARMDWCYGDVIEVHGDMFDSTDQMPVIYPDLDPAARAMATPDPIPELQSGPSPFVVEPPPPDPAGAAQTPTPPVPPPPRAQGSATAPGSTQATARRTGQQRQDGPILPSSGRPSPLRPT
ncbi:MAG: general secretion pathway protein GspD, partial [Planctomycetes bacterium]|nr:general secretion pathway protein GspD [Planctomycetota bacterium]